MSSEFCQQLRRQSEKTFALEKGYVAFVRVLLSAAKEQLRQSSTRQGPAVL